MRKINRLTGRTINVERGSGRTTAILLRAVADAIDNPGTWIDLKDHEGGTKHYTLTVWAMEMIQQLRLSHFHVCRTGRIKSTHIGITREAGDE